MLADSILSGTGYDPLVTEGLPVESVRRLALVESLRSITVIAIAGSVAYAVFVSLQSTTYVGPWALTLGAGALVLLFSLQRLAVCVSGPGLVRGDSALDGWRPSRYRVVLMLIAGIVMAQPILLAAFHAEADQQIASRIQDVVRVQLSRQQEVLVRSDAALRLKRAQLVERLSTVGDTSSASPQNASVMDALASGLPARKALVIGAQRYRQMPLQNSARDAVEMSSKLKAMGFDVTTSIDEPRDLLQSRLNRYFESLRPGDISVIFYAGHGYQKKGHNYLVPIDFRPQEGIDGIRITPFLDAADLRSPQLQMIILDACRVFTSDGFKPDDGGLAELQGGKNSFIAMAAKPGMEALDGPPGTHGVFTEAVLRHIARAEDINVLFRRISGDVQTAARALSFEQQPVVTSTLTNEYVQLVDPRISPPESPFEISTPVEAVSVAAPARITKPIDCPPPVGVDLSTQRAAVTNCLRAKIMAIDRTLQEWQFAGRMALREDASASRRALLESGLFTEKIGVLWSTLPVLMAFLTLVFSLMLGAAEILQLFFHKDFVQYHSGRNRLAANSLRLSHQASISKSESSLAPVRHLDYHGLEHFRTRPMAFDASSPKQVWADDLKYVTSDQRQVFVRWLRNSRKTATAESL